MKNIPEPLTDCEVRVMTALARGLTRKLIADELGCSVSVINFHLGNIFRKWEIKSATAAVCIFVQQK